MAGQVLTDLPVVPVCRRPAREIAVARYANQFAAELRRVGKAQACPPSRRAFDDPWWARRKCAFCPPYISAISRQARCFSRAAMRSRIAFDIGTGRWVF